MWGAIDEWTDDFVKDQPQNFLTTASIAIILLIALGCFNTTSSRGVRNLQVKIKSVYFRGPAQKKFAERSTYLFNESKGNM